jgi:hypothetical protein
MQAVCNIVQMADQLSTLQGGREFPDRRRQAIFCAVANAPRPSLPLRTRAVRLRCYYCHARNIMGGGVISLHFNDYLTEDKFGTQRFS